MDGPDERYARLLEQQGSIVPCLLEIGQQFCLRGLVDQDLGVGHPPGPVRRAGRLQGALHAAGIAARDHGANQRGTDHAAHHPQRLQHRRCNAEVRAARRLLGEHGQVRQHEAEPETGQQHGTEQHRVMHAARGLRQTEASQRQQCESRIKHAVRHRNARDDAAIENAADGDADHHRRHQQPGFLRRIAKPALEQQRCVEQQREHGKTAQHAKHEQRGQRRIAEHVERQQGVRRPVRPLPEADERGHGQHGQANRHDVQPALGQPFHRKLEAAEPRRNQQRTQPVHPNRPLPLVRLMAQVRQVSPREQQAEQAHRHVDIEDGTPAIPFSQHAAHGRADGVGKPERGAHHHLPAQAHVRVREQIGNTGESGADEHAAANALQRACRHEERHAGRHAAQHRGHQEDHDRHQHEWLAAVVVAQPAEDRHGDDRGQQVGRGHPGVVLEALQFGDHRRQRGGHHGLVQRHEHHHEGDADHRQQRFPERQDLPVAGRMWSALPFL
ncbi:hypothetical protein D3C72_1118150 [compost metagenome]